MQKLTPLTLALCSALLGACSLVPTTDTGPLPIASQYPDQTSEAGLELVQWRQFFNQPELTQLIELALTQNKDLRLATLSVARVQAQYQIAEAGLYPAVGLNASSSRQRQPASLSGAEQAQLLSQSSVQLGITAYELDLFGKTRALTEQALQQFYASEQNRAAAQISLISEVARQWYSYAANQQLAELATHTLHSQQKSQQLIEQSYQLGASSELELQQVRTTVAAALVAQSNYHRQLQQSKNALELLVASAVPTNLLPHKPLSELQTLPDVPAGMPSDLLTHRPDLKAAEHQLIAANANIGVAKAAFFPAISLTATAGTASSDLNGLFKAGSGAWSFVPQLSLPIFDWSRNQANLQVAQTDSSIALETYQQKIQQAFREVADALADQQGYRQQLTALELLSQSNQRAFELANARYQQGSDSYLQVLDAQRNWYSAQQQLINGQQARLVAQLNLYKVLGGGWSADEQS